MDIVRILNAKLHNLTFEELLERYSSGLMIGLNVDTLMKLQKDPEYAAICAEAEYVVADGKIMVYASRLLGTPLRDKISGSDFVGAFCERYKDDAGVKVFLLGAGPGIAARAQARINERLGREVVIGAHSPSFGFENKPEECDEIIRIVNDSGATVLAVGVGAPKQEKWIARHRARMPNVKRFFAIGATIDFEAAAIKRAPTWMSQVGFEWLFRLIQEPKRLSRRYLIEGPPFFWLLFQQRVGRYRDPHGRDAA
jgi:N-acetylglucosaminyldiphosphoundecaprenol N-acetyl-beta-D-mannosaminyltransferase